ncbi:NUDIX hydrolase [Hoyosella rhizosphaerae]|uniref:NUDIX hydrolase n=1 Tax=Hoyosella rhizosphaerae TaxID=1755582 RepID=A0A916X987_9ACTN|nr:NUDIX hydrolase [Hoyosella rhizosphaerae]MBN4926771.1 NUDIX hydrolase [Hoyosella rhizosphaerae]GGC56619.1 hypothetical protein GCM10011410_06340 [Hoyosella rhizosphaerae]
MGEPSAQHPEPPVLTDGVVTLRPWTDNDVNAAVAGNDDELTRWVGQTSLNNLHDAPTWSREAFADNRRVVNLVIEHQDLPVGYVEVRRTGATTGDLQWALFAGHRGRGLATRSLALLADYAFTELHLSRLQAYVDVDNHRSIRLATRSGLRREGVLRKGDARDNKSHDTVVLARLADDPPLRDPAGFREILNAFLPRKRAISQLLIRDDQDRVLLCQLTYKRDWDLPGGVVEVGESPHLAASREAEEELGITVTTGPLLLTDWLPPWGGWDDAVCLVFDGGTYPPTLTDQITVDGKEIKSAMFCTPSQVQRLCADFTARRIEAALNAAQGGGTNYTESGRTTA